MSARPIRFIDTTQTSFDCKRQQVSRACDGCRKKKKRCFHVLEEDTGRVNDSSSREALSQRRSSATLTLPGSSDLIDGQVHGTDTNSDRFEKSPACDAVHNESASPRGTIDANCDDNVAKRQRSLSHSARFIGNTNPEGAFLTSAEIEPDVHPEIVKRRKIGSWSVEQRIGIDMLAGQHETLPPRLGLFNGLKPAVLGAIMPILEQECLSTIPPLIHRDALSALYFEKFNPLLPLVKKSAYDSMPAQSPARLLLDQGICLVASMDLSSSGHLYLADESTILGRRDFGHQLLAALRINIETSKVVDKVILVQLLALMSLFQEGPDGAENSMSMLGHAVQHLQSLGLHLCMEQEDSYFDHAETLFCCVWFLDRLRAASQGRPVLMHEMDNNRSIQQCLGSQAPLFRLLLRIGLLLDEVIATYRPQYASTVFISEFALFEDLAVECQATQLSPHVLATVEVAYHAVAILSCHPALDSSEHNSKSSRRMRQLWSAERATSLVGEEFLGQVVLLPFVPYAVSLSLSISYRELRRSKLPTHRARARKGLETNCKILEDLGEISGSAAAIAKMGRITLRELDRVCSTVKESGQLNYLNEGQLEAQMGTTQRRRSTSTPSCQDKEAPADFSNDCYYYTGVPGPDPFEMFDPNFDLTGIDLFFEGNLDPSFPM